MILKLNPGGDIFTCFFIFFWALLYVFIYFFPSVHYVRSNVPSGGRILLLCFFTITTRVGTFNWMWVDQKMEGLLAPTAARDKNEGNRRTGEGGGGSLLQYGSKELRQERSKTRP